jgi:hypothetical protein
VCFCNVNGEMRLALRRRHGNNSICIWCRSRNLFSTATSCSDETFSIFLYVVFDEFVSSLFSLNFLDELFSLHISAIILVHINLGLIGWLCLCKHS